MKNLFFGIFVAASMLLSSCDNNKEARNLYYKAKSLYEQGLYIEAKLVTDSIKIVNNTAFDEIRAGMQLSRKAELAINEIIANDADSLLKIYRAQVDEIIKDFELVKDEEYQTDGTLVYKHDPNRESQTKSCIRIYITEEGELVMLSVYCGSNAIQHESIKLTASDGTFAMSEVIPYDGARNYRYKINGQNIETITYNEPKTLGIAQFVIGTKGAPIKVSYDGKRPYSYTLEKSSRKAIVESYRFAKLIKEVKRLERDEAIASKTIVILRKQIEDHKGDSI